MLTLGNLSKRQNCYMNEAMGYGYAFVPGGNAGIVILDRRSLRLLSNPLLSQSDSDLTRINLLVQKGLLIDSSADLTQPLSLSIDGNGVRTLGTWLHVANACNLNCPYCYIRKCNKLMPEVVADAYVRKLEESISRHNIREVVVRFAGGEPMLQKKLVFGLMEKITKRMQEHNVISRFALITNGTLLDESWIEFIKLNNVRVSISLDGVEKWHNKTRFFSDGSGTFKSVWKAIQLCKASGLDPTILTTMTEANVEGIPELTRLLIESNLGSRYGVYRDTSTNDSYAGYPDFISKLTDALRQSYDYYADAIKNNGISFKHQLADIRIDRHRHLRCCSAGRSGISVNYDGRVYLCQSEMADEQKSIGSVYQDSNTFLEMLNKQNVMPNLKTKNVSDYKQCSSCQWSVTCGGGCPMVSYNTYGTFTTASPYCELFKRFIPRLIDLKALSLICEILKKGGATYGRADHSSF